MKDSQVSGAIGALARGAPSREGLAWIIGQIAGAMEHTMTAGDLAQLRRLDPAMPAGAAFWKLVAWVLEPAGCLPPAEAARDRAEQQWACVIAAMARCQGLHRSGINLGAALATAGYSEQRFERLLRASEQRLTDAVREVATYVAVRAEPFDAADLADLVFSDERAHAEHVRRRLARSYYGALTHNAKKD